MQLINKKHDDHNLTEFRKFIIEIKYNMLINNHNNILNNSIIVTINKIGKLR